MTTTTNSTVRITGGDAPPFCMKLADFLRDNADGIDEAEAKRITDDLFVGRTYVGGGGAGIEFKIEPYADPVMNISTSYDFPPIPVRNCDWSAVDADNYEGDGCPIGRGATEEEAIADLKAQMEDAA